MTEIAMWLLSTEGADQCTDVRIQEMAVIACSDQHYDVSVSITGQAPGREEVCFYAEGIPPLTADDVHWIDLYDRDASMAALYDYEHIGVRSGHIEIDLRWDRKADCQNIVVTIMAILDEVGFARCVVIEAVLPRYEWEDAFEFLPKMVRDPKVDSWFEVRGSADIIAIATHLSADDTNAMAIRRRVENGRLPNGVMRESEALALRKRAAEHGVAFEYESIDR